VKLTLIRPPAPNLVQSNSYGPLGLGYLAAYVRRELPSVQVTLCDMASGDSPRSADIFGYTATSLDYERVVGLAYLVAEWFPGAKHIIGGAHSTVFKDECDPIFDAVFVGEGEESLVRYLKELQDGNKWLTRVRPSVPLEMLDELPFPVRERIEDKQLVSGDAHSVTVMASRGCPYRCTFCATEAMWGKRTRWRSPRNVAAELEVVKRDLGATDVAFLDDTITVNKQWLFQLCDMIEPMGLRWRALSRVDLKESEVIFRRMKRAGCTEVCFGVESFDSKVLALLDKRTKPEQAEHSIRLAHEVGLNARVFMMIGTPGESTRTVDINIEYMERIREALNLVTLSTFMPLPGTALYNEPKKYGIEIVDDHLDHHNRYQWGPDGENAVYSPIRILGMTQEEQYENIRKMRDYVGGLKAANRGIPT
jgi:radical SAM superfamily enzyme YgiQ (UPF0313 family)